MLKSPLWKDAIPCRKISSYILYSIYYNYNIPNTITITLPINPISRYCIVIGFYFRLYIDIGFNLDIHIE